MENHPPTDRLKPNLARPSKQNILAARKDTDRLPSGKHSSVQYTTDLRRFSKFLHYLI